MPKNLEELLNTNIEPEPLARRREFPEMIRDIVASGAEVVQIRMDARSALNLAKDVEFAVKYRKLEYEEASDSSGT